MKKILVIDDDDLVRQTVDRVLQRAGYSTETASGADEALEAVRKTKFDLIVSDIKMPGKDGVQGIKEIRAFFDKHSGPDLPIVFITGYADLGQELNAEELGEIIVKPFDLEHLLITIREYL